MDRLKIKNLISVLLLLVVLPLNAFAGVHCVEKIKATILHQNGNVYFTSTKTCPNWCQIKWVGEGDKDRAFSMLLAARTADREVTFYWTDLSSCSEINPTYQSPGYVLY